MKTNFKILLASLLFTTGCSTSYMGTSAYEDDIYYSPGSAPLLVQEVKNVTEPATFTAASVTSQTKTEPNNSSYEANNYRQGYSFSPGTDERDFTPFQEKYSTLIAGESLENESFQSMDTIVNEEEEAYEEEGYYLNEFKGSEMDKADAERIRMYYPQGFGYWYGNGYHTAMMLAGDPDWNVYVKGNYVWWTPTWTNYYFYNDFRFHPNRYGRLFAYSHGLGYYGGYDYYYDSYSYRYPYWDLYFDWHYPGYGFGFGFGFGHRFGYYGYPYYGYYGYYGHHGYHGHHKHQSYYGHHTNSAGYYYGSRKSLRLQTINSKVSGTNFNSRNTINNAASTTYGRRSVTDTKSGTTSTRVTTSRSSPSGTIKNLDVRRKQAAARYSSGGTRLQSKTSTTRGSITGTKSQSVSPGTRYSKQSQQGYSTTRRNVPSYSTPQTGTRPAYNRSGTSNQSKTSVNKSFSKTRPSGYRSGSNRSSGYSKVKSSSYNRGSSSSGSVRQSPSSSGRSSSGYRSSGSSSQSSGSVSSGRSSGSRSSGTSRSPGGNIRKR